MARKAARGRASSRETGDPNAGRARSLSGALGLTLASGLLWGVAHLWAGRRLAGVLLMALFMALVTTVVIAVTVFGGDLTELAVQSQWLTRGAGALAVLGLVWVAVVIRSYQVVRPAGLGALRRTAGIAAVTVLCSLVALPVAEGVRIAQDSNHTLSSIFRSGTAGGRRIDRDDPWDGLRRVNVLLLGGDAGPNRIGVRTDSMTLASVDTRTGDTVLLSLPRNLENVPLPPGPARDRFPYGFTGDGPMTPGLLNEVYDYAENHPDVVPGVPKDRRGPELIKGTFAEILGLPVHYYILVDMQGFADLIDAMGGVRMTVPEDIVYGRFSEGRVKAGTRVLSGKEALWYGRSRTNSDDYVRMGRQKCLLRAVARQANPQLVLTRFHELASAARRTISTDIPAELLPALVKLSAKMRDGARIDSLQFIPPLINTGNPDFELIRKLAAEAIAESERARESGSPAPSPSSASPKPETTADQSSPSPSPSPQTKPVSLDETCPS
ncbi:LCP family protein [Thermomonospora sp. CIF 1]|uniref:LCP family protein n=1 Tax=Thermomonospora sp. CIF 1 TaxID=1916083 RepID=UPI000A51D1BD|nr:LCP family protein [Thermomonospora sp. CIF 1]PKK13955.1 MAG: transcriptional regulator [Thermomonospora sp. CIF 1]